MDETTAIRDQALSTELNNRKKANKYNNKECYHCKGKGHVAADCFFSPITMKFKGDKGNDKRNEFEAKNDSGEETVIMVI